MVCWWPRWLQTRAFPLKAGGTFTVQNGQMQATRVQVRQGVIKLAAAVHCCGRLARTAASVVLYFECWRVVWYADLIANCA